MMKLNTKEWKKMLGIPGEKAFSSTRKRRDANGYYKMTGNYHKALQGLDILLRNTKEENADESAGTV